jgi:hypothetical protein
MALPANKTAIDGITLWELREFLKYNEFSGFNSVLISFTIAACVKQSDTVTAPDGMATPGNVSRDGITATSEDLQTKGIRHR